MGLEALMKEAGSPAWGTYHDWVRVATRERLQFVDLTQRIIEHLRRSRIQNGIVNVQTRHTTSPIFINENEPLLLEDIRRLLDRLAPISHRYRHDDFRLRTVNLLPGENKNGDAHCKAMFLRTSETLNVVDGTLQLGRWQRIFLAEMDRGRNRTVSVMILGE